MNTRQVQKKANGGPAGLAMSCLVLVFLVLVLAGAAPVPVAGRAAGSDVGLSSAFDLNASRAAAAGEPHVDTAPQSDWDFGDAPDPTYPTLLGSDGARHELVPGGPSLRYNKVTSAETDAETDGQPNDRALGDDWAGNNDEDAVWFGGTTGGLWAGDPSAVVTIYVDPVAHCFVNAWIDFDQDGAWNGLAEHILDDVFMPAGSVQTAHFAIPVSAVVASPTYARVRCNSTGGLTPTGPAADGEVEDYQITIQGQDYGDAPGPPYPTLHWGDPTGAGHTIDPNFFLGANIDAEWDGQPGPDAMGDDNAGSDDEDGITFLTPLAPGSSACVQIEVVDSIANEAAIAAWIDFNGNGIWEIAEHLFDPIGGASEPVSPGITMKCFTVPAWAKAGATYARFRLGTEAPVDPQPYQRWWKGEVEDYKVNIVATKWRQPPTLNEELPDNVCYWGWDELSVYDQQDYPIAADDWLCQDDRRVTDIHWWGSYENWEEALPPVQAPDGFHIAIWSDMPAGELHPWSHPDRLVQQWTAPRGFVNERVSGCDFHPEMMPAPDTCFAYDFVIPPNEWFSQEPGPTVYWLSISAIYPDHPPAANVWGWKTRRGIWNDAAVRITAPDAPEPGSDFWEGEPIMTGEGPWDMAFVITTEPGPPEPPQISIAIDSTNRTDAELSWPHVQQDVYGYPVIAHPYRIYRDTSPYFAPGAGNLAKTLTGPFPPGSVVWDDANKIGDVIQNYYYVIQAVTTDSYGADLASTSSNQVGEFDFELAPGS